MAITSFVSIFLDFQRRKQGIHDWRDTRKGVFGTKGIHDWRDNRTRGISEERGSGQERCNHAVLEIQDKRDARKERETGQR